MYKPKFVHHNSTRAKNKSNLWVIPVYHDSAGGFTSLGEQGAELNKKWNGELGNIISRQSDFKGKRGETLHIPIKINKEADQVLFVGMGTADSLDEKGLKGITGIISKNLQSINTECVNIVANSHMDGLLLNEEIGAHLADQIKQRSYHFDKYKSSLKHNTQQQINILTDRPALAFRQYLPLSAVTNATHWAADLTNEPANVLTPVSYAETLKKNFPHHGVTVKVLDEKKMKMLGMGAALAVGQGSKTPPRMVIMEYNGTGNPNSKPLALVGKGITFDTGGYSLKDTPGMESMKMDMGGSAAVVGAMRALAETETNAHVVAVVALAENMIDKDAYRVSDIVKSMSGKTIEIKNTDAEGRLVLADALTYVQRTYNPHTVIDLATLTGAAKRTFDGQYAAVFSNNDSLWQKIETAGKKTGEAGWRLPLHEAFSDAMKGTVSDLVNSANAAFAGSSKAAEFLHHFIEKDVYGYDKCKWGHIDMAGMQLDEDGIANGFGVRLLHRLITDHFQPGAQNKPGPAIPPSPSP